MGRRRQLNIQRSSSRCEQTIISDIIRRYRSPVPWPNDDFSDLHRIIKWKIYVKSVNNKLKQIKFPTTP